MAIDLRKRFECKTLRNFVGTTQFETKIIDDDIISQEFKKHIAIATNEKQLSYMILLTLKKVCKVESLQ